MRNVPTSPSRAAALTLAAAACVGGGIAVASQVDDTTAQRLADPRAAVQPTGTPAAVARAFGVLKADATEVPPAVTEAFARSPQLSDAFAPNSRLARPLPVTNPYTGTQPWIAPAEDGACLYVPDTDGTAATTCSTLEEARRGDLHVVLAPFGEPSFAVGVVPDGVTSVTATNADGSSEELHVRANTFAIRSATVRTIAIGDTVMTVPQAPKSPPPLPQTGQ